MKRAGSPAGVIDESALMEYLTRLGVEEIYPELLSRLKQELETRAKEQVRLKKNKERIKNADQAKKQVPATSVLSAHEKEMLPKWVQTELNTAVVVGNTGDVIQVADGRKYHRKNRLNELPGNRWTVFLNSVINTRFPTSGPEAFAHEIRKIHPSPKPPQLMRDIVEFFTKEGEFVFDYFMGVGGTLLGASLCNRRALGIDLNDSYIDAYKRATMSLKLNEQATLHGDSLALLADGVEINRILSGEKAALILIDPPYGDMLSRSRTGEAIKDGRDSSPTPFTESSSDLGNMPLEDFFRIFRESVESSLKFLKPRGHVVVFMKDLQPTRDSTNLLHARTIECLTSINRLNYLGLKIWADQSVNLYPYGYPFAFVANQIHQYIMVFRME